MTFNFSFYIIDFHNLLSRMIFFAPKQPRPCQPFNYYFFCHIIFYYYFYIIKQSNEVAASNEVGDTGIHMVSASLQHYYDIF